MENIIKNIASTVFNVSKDEVILKQRLLGGMSNNVLVFEVQNNLYTFRIVGKNGELFVEREEELQNIEIIKPLEINNQTIFFDINTGYKIANYIEGTPLSEFDEPEKFLPEISNVLKKLHNSNLKATKDYNPFKRLEKYEGYLTQFDYKHQDLYIDLKQKFYKQKDFLDKIELVFCHNDAQLSNMVEGDKIYLLDWEFSANNDPLYDVACLAAKDIDFAIKLLTIYLEKPPTQDEIDRVYLWRAFQCLQWHNVAIYKHLIGLGAELSVDFDKAANMYLSKANELLTNF
ncbi:MAG: phosphotransferase [Epulopiscium sp. Nele67-Bin005]|nr:MAG: phosphotransferase [Epulopiscium sp. Nele67-Bin005]